MRTLRGAILGLHALRMGWWSFMVLLLGALALWRVGLKLAFFCPRQDHRERFQISEGAMSICLEVADLEAAIAHLQTLGQSSTSPIIIHTVDKPFQTLS
jgi:hypothetical protein